MAEPQGTFELVVIGDKQVVQRFSALPPKIRSAVVKKGMTQAVVMLADHIRRTKLSGQVLKVRSGRLIASISHRVEERGDEIIGKVGTNVKYARIHEYGGVIRGNPRLAIPLAAARSPSGVARFTPRQVIGNPGSAGFIGTFTRNGVIFGTKPGGGIVPLFVLKSSVRIPPRPFMRPALQEKRKEIADIVAASIREAMKQT